MPLVSSFVHPFSHSFLSNFIRKTRYECFAFSWRLSTATSQLVVSSRRFEGGKIDGPGTESCGPGTKDGEIVKTRGGSEGEECWRWGRDTARGCIGYIDESE